jgi:hypothetical protein
MADAAGSSPALLEPANTPSPEITYGQRVPGCAAGVPAGIIGRQVAYRLIASFLQFGGDGFRRVGAEFRSPDLHPQPANLCPPQCRRGFAAAVVVVFSVSGLRGVFSRDSAPLVTSRQEGVALITSACSPTRVSTASARRDAARSRRAVP